jgi:hypothetical protein
MSPLNAAICTTISYTLWVEWYYIKTIIWPWGQRSRSHEGHYGTRHTALWSCTHILNIIDLSRDKNVMARTRKYYLKNNYLTLRPKVKVPWRSLRYTTHRLIVMHIQTICQWTVLLDLFELFDLEIKGHPTKVIMVCDTPPYGHAPTYQLSFTYLERQKVMARTRKYYLKNNYLTLRSKVKVTWRSLRYVTHRLMVMHPHTKYHWPISKDKKVMARQASLRRSGRSRRSGRKNQTKTICLPSFEGET